MARRPKAPAPISKASAAADGATAILVTGPKAGRWRAGQYFTGEAKRIELAELTDDELAAITGDPALMVVEAPAVPPAGAPGGQAAASVPGSQAPIPPAGAGASNGT